MTTTSDRCQRSDLQPQLSNALDNSTADACWLWTGSTTAKGFPRHSAGRTFVSPHRVLYEAHTGQPLGRLVLRRNCGQKLCINPKHATAVDRGTLMLNTDEPLPTNCHSGRRGVYRHGKRWRAQIRRDGQAITIGVFGSVSEADAAAREARAQLRQASA